MAPLEERVKTGFLVIGSGIAGLRAAIELSRRGKKVTLVTKSKIEDANTYYAQGGISAVDPIRAELGEDSYEAHVRDTLKAGDGLCDEGVVRSFVEKAFESTIRFLMDYGVKFSQDEDGQYVLHQEGGHSQQRIYCVGDHTGRSVEERLAAIVREDPNITVLEDHAAVNLITYNQFSRVKLPIDRCLGAYVLDRQAGKVKTFESDVTFLATGGAGRVFMYTSNPVNATGDGIGMAYRAGAEIANMEFFQFHPTVLFEPGEVSNGNRKFLLTEALRGKAMGGILTLSKDSLDDFVLAHDPEGSHGTRDVVARAIDTEMKKRGLHHVWLNVTSSLTGKSPEEIRKSYPDIYAHCLERGIDITKDPIPVVPAAHYTCGGVLADEFGRTNLNGLYAIGEVACTGLMGANRLASNSLPEGALYGLLAVEHAIASVSHNGHNYLEVPLWQSGNVKTAVDVATLNQFWDSTRSIMTNLCGIDRNEQRLQAAVEMLEGLVKAADVTYREFYPTHEILELRNLTQVAGMIARAALERRESRGGHYRSDFPQKDDVHFKRYNVMKKER